MADNTSSIPPSSSTRSLTTGSSNLLVGSYISAPNQSESTNLPIEHAPQQIIEQAEEQAQILEGRVIYSNPNTEEMRIAIEEGEIVLKTKVDLPHDTKVEIKIYNQNNKMVADIEVIGEIPNNKLAQTEIIQDTFINDKVDLSKLPYIQEGQKLQASLMPSEKTQTIENILYALNKIDKASVLKLDLGGLTLQQKEAILFGNEPEEALNLLSTHVILDIAKAIKDNFGIFDINNTKSPVSNIISQAYNPGTPHITKETPVTNMPLITDTNNINNNNDDNDIFNIIGTVSRNDSNNNKEVSKTISSPIGNIKVLDDTDNNAYQYQSLTTKKYRLDVIEISTNKLDKKEIRNHILKINNEIGNYHTSEYKELPIKVATIESFTPQGHPVIKASTYNVNNIYAEPEEETFTLQQGLNIKEDSLIFIKAVPINNHITPEIINNMYLENAQKIDIYDFSPFEDKEWNALKKAIQIATTSQTQAINNISNIIPNPAKDLPTTALFFLAALRFGSIKGWLGDNLESLDDDTLEVISKDFSKISDLSKDTSGAWRVISMPLYYEGNLEQIQIYIQNDKNQDDKSKREKSQRFIFNLNLSNMGHMQLDGMLYKENKILNMIIRSTDGLTDDIRNNITQKFISGLEQTGFKGDISFQNKNLISF